MRNWHACRVENMGPISPGSTQKVVVGSAELWYLQEPAVRFGFFHVRNENRDDLAGEFVLNRKSAAYRAVIPFSPAVDTSLRIDELCGDTDAIVAFADASFKDIT